MNYYLDIETTTDHETVRVVGVRGDGENQMFYLASQLSAWLSYSINKGDRIVTYNGEGFDFPVLKKVWGIDIVKVCEFKDVELMDAFIMSKLAFNDRPSHSLDSWAKEIDPSFTKLEVDYDNCDIDKLVEYLERDLEITERVFERILAKVGEIAKAARVNGESFSFKMAMKVEQQVRRIINEQRERGIPFDYNVALLNRYNLEAEMEKLERITHSIMPSAPIRDSQLRRPPKIQFKKDGSLSAHMERYLNEHDAVYHPDKKAVWSGGKLFSFPLTEPLATTSRIKLGEQQRLKDWLLGQGWSPTMWNTDKEGNKTSPRLLNTETKEPCPHLSAYLPTAVIERLSVYATLKSRHAQIGGENSGLLSRCRNEGGEWIIHHDADTLGTPTGRFRHKSVVNIPRPSSPYGERIRELFIPFDGDEMVGWDASSLEARMEAHYTYPFDKAYALELVTGDVHSRNMKLLGLPDRDTAKKFKYAITYGARPKKLAQSLGVSLSTATGWYENFWDANPGLAKLIRYIEKEWEAFDCKYIKGLDGRLLMTRHKHSLLNTKLQGAGAIVMKYAMLIAHKRLADLDPGCKALIRYHDEEQWSVPKGLGHLAGDIGAKSIAEAGRYLKLNVPLAGDYKVGENWAQTH